MLAIIETGGKQYLVKSGEVLKVEKIAGEKGQNVEFDKVLMSADDDGARATIGRPYVAGAKVSAEIIDQIRDKKIRVVKFKNKVRYKKVHGHRQCHTKIKIK